MGPQLVEFSHVDLYVMLCESRLTAVRMLGRQPPMHNRRQQVPMHLTIDPDKDNWQYDWQSVGSHALTTNLANRLSRDEWQS